MANIRNFLKDRTSFFKEVFAKWNSDNCFNLSAALSYYTIFSLAPIIIIVVSIAGYFFGQEAVTGEIYGQIKGLIGEEGARGVQNLVERAYLDQQAGLIAKTVGVATLVVAATAAFSTLQNSINTIWEVRPKASKGMFNLVASRLLSFALVVSIAFLLIVSLVVSTLLHVINNYIAYLLTDWSVYVIQALQFALSFGIMTVLFAMIFKFLPDANMKWNELWHGSLVTAALFTIGKFLIGVYLGNSNLSSSYGAAASVIVILLWVNYSALIFFFGAEYVFVHVRRKGSHLQPSRNAVRVFRKEVEYDHDEGTRTEIIHGKRSETSHKKPSQA